MRCPRCKSHVFDNRRFRQAAKTGRTQPAFQCMNFRCNWATWDPEWDGQ